MRTGVASLAAVALVAGLLVPHAGAQVADPTVPPGRETEAVVLTGTNFPEWATLGDIAVKANSIEGAQCNGKDLPDELPDEMPEEMKEGVRQGLVTVFESIPDSPVSDDQPCSHSEYEDPDASTADLLANEGVPVDTLRGYRWSGERFEQIPFQVDEMFTRYLSNDESGFSFYSETDQHTSYAFDREGFRWTESDPANACLARPASEVAKDPVPGLDTDDEMAFMARDGGDRAPSDASLPDGIEDSYEVAIVDPMTGAATFAYVMRAAEDGPAPAFDASNGYVRYQRDEDANIFLFSQSSYDGYGDAPKGAWQDEDGVCHSDPSEYRQRRPGDQATITTPRYRFRYEGRWLMTELNISSDPEGDWNYGPDVIDQWKARAFQQRPGGETPCCGYEEEVNNWGGSSILMGERSGPVRTIRETWGADSGTNVVRREIFYRDEIRFISFLRVHVIPPGDGIYAQWDYNAGIMTRYYNPLNPEGAPIDGKNDDQGNTHIYASHDGLEVDPDGENGEQEPIGQGKDRCPHDGCINNDVDVPDPAFSGVNAGANWEQIAGPQGTLVSRYQFHKVTGGSAHSVVTVPYYRDDACFDDGTGSNPGPHIDGRDVDGDEESDSHYTAADGTRQPRECWDSETDYDGDGDVDLDDAPAPDGDPRFYQGSIGTHGVHILLITDSDNAHTTVPVTEIDGDQRVVVLPGEQPNVGERYGRQPEKPLVVAVAPMGVAPGLPGDSTPTASPTGTATATPSPTETEPAPSDVAFTDASADGGQFSDDALVQARLVDDASDEPIAGAELTFELTGADGTTSWTDTTGDDGVAGRTIALDRAPGSYQLTVHYAGTEDRAADTDQRPFVIDKEDAALALSVDGKGSGRALVARLTDADSGAAIAGREIAFSADGNSLGSAATNGDGVARFDLPSRYRNGHHDYSATFGGDDFFLTATDRRQT